MKSRQLEQLAKLGDLRDKGLLTEVEFAEQKAALMGAAETPSAGHPRRSLIIGMVLAAVVGGLASAAFTWTVRSDLRDKQAALAKRVASEPKPETPKLHITYTKPIQSGGQSLSTTTHRLFFSDGCPDGSVLIGGQWEVSGGFGPELFGDGHDVGAWYVDAAANNPGTGKMKVTGTCLSGDGIDLTSDE